LGRNQRNEIIRRAATHKSDAQLMAKWVENQTRWKEREKQKELVVHHQTKKEKEQPSSTTLGRPF
jgi:hypothetical protein